MVVLVVLPQPLACPNFMFAAGGIEPGAPTRFSIDKEVAYHGSEVIVSSRQEIADNKAPVSSSSSSSPLMTVLFYQVYLHDDDGFVVGFPRPAIKYTPFEQKVLSDSIKPITDHVVRLFAEYKGTCLPPRLPEAGHRLFFCR
jgi:hypothetical protein